MTLDNRNSVWRLVLRASADLGDALATPRGVAPDRAIGQALDRPERS